MSEEKQEQREGTYRSADLLKMHAYKDAIRRTGGAYVLYPGDKSLGRRGFHEIIPGLGAFAVSPSRSSEGTKELEQFIRQVRDLFVNRISQREQMALQTRRIHANGLRESVSLNVAVPEFIDETDLLNAEEIRVLVGYYRSKEQLKWIVERKKYNFRSGNRSGSLKMDPKTAGARYLLLHGQKEERSSFFYALNGKGPVVMLRGQLEEIGYPKDPAPESSYRIYYVYENLTPVKDREFQDITIDLTKLGGYKDGRQKGHPFTTSLSEVMNALVRMEG